MKNNQQEIDWAFDCKDSGYFSGDNKQNLLKNKQIEINNKFGNFNTPIIIKLCSKFNKQISNEANRADPLKLT
jgi:hypothetical protein